MIIETLRTILDSKKGQLFGCGYYLHEDGTLMKEGKDGIYTEFNYLDSVSKMIVHKDKIELVTFENGQEYISIIENDVKRSINNSLDIIDNLCKKMGYVDKPIPALTLRESIDRFDESCKRLNKIIEKQGKNREILEDINESQVKLNNEIKGS